MIKLSWDIHWNCNFRCPYCWFHDKWDSIQNRNYYPDKNIIINTWDRIYALYGGVHIQINGGEPFVYPDFIDILSKILEKHTVAVSTNLSIDVKKILKKIHNKHNLRLNATFHPEFINSHEYIKRVIELKNGDFDITMVYLAYPPQIADLPGYHEEFNKAGLHLGVSTFWGNYAGKKYPDSYTEDQIRMINPELSDRGGEKFQLSPVKVKDRLCNAGHTYGAIQPDGKVIRCGGGGFNGKEEIIGNVFNEEFRLLEKPLPCISDVCPCNEWAELLVK